MDIRCMYTAEDFSYINDKSHAAAFINYLFRTDKVQKWTNNYTQLNYYALREEDTINMYSDSDIAERRKELSEKVKLLIKDKDIKKMKNEIMYIDVEDIDTDILKDMFSSGIFRMNEIWNEVHPDLETDFMASTFCFVLHVDQGELHIHRFFYDDEF